MTETKPFVLLREYADPSRTPSEILRSTRVVRPAHVRSQKHRWFRRVNRDLRPAEPTEFPTPRMAADRPLQTSGTEAEVQEAPVIDDAQSTDGGDAEVFEDIDHIEDDAGERSTTGGPDVTGDPRLPAGTSGEVPRSTPEKTI